MYIFDCDGQITLEKFNSDTLFDNAKLELTNIELDSTNNYSFNFKTSNFRLGEKTNNPYQLAASKKGQHIHFIDAGDGGYAMTTKQLKIQIKQAKPK